MSGAGRGGALLGMEGFLVPGPERWRAEEGPREHWLHERSVLVLWLALEL